MNIKEILFGKEITLTDTFFGQIESSKTRSKKAKELSQFFKYRISDFKSDTDIIAEGNYLGINKNQRDILIDFIMNLDSKYSVFLDELIGSDPKMAILTNWRKEYFISVIHPFLSESPYVFEMV